MYSVLDKTGESFYSTYS